MKTRSSADPHNKKSHTQDDIQNWLRIAVSGQTGISPDEIAINEPFTRYGLSSKDAIVLSGELENWLERDFSVFSLYEYPTIEALARYLVSPPDPHHTDWDAKEYTNVVREPVAIVGIGCRFPGADNPQEFWELLRQGKNTISEVPRERWDIDQYYDPDPSVAGKMNSRKGSFLKNIDQFDPHFFNISPREAACIDPQQRLLLEIAWEAMEDAGIPPAELANTSVGVFIGVSNCDYLRIQIGSDNVGEPYAGTGSSLAIAANRLSYVFGFQGPSIAIDTACSSSLVAVHLACNSLWNGESSLALAGGVNLILLPTININFSKTGFLSPDGQVKAFDANANGYVRGEGAGVVMLKLLSEAQKDGNPVYAVIRGSAVNQDGKSNGLTSPNRQSQEKVIRNACHSAQILPGQVQYVEAHGTGTSIGDPIEVTALGNVTSVGRPPGTVCYIGSVKTNIGHLESASGIAGLVKVALALKRQAIPPSLNFQTPNPYIPFDNIPVRVQQQLGKWPISSVPKLAGVSSFGFGGTNAHVILEEAPAVPLPAPEISIPSAQILVLSADSVPALKSLAARYLALLLKAPAEFKNITLADICYNTACRRSHHPFRLAVVAHSFSAMAEKLSSYIDGAPGDGIYFSGTKPISRPSIALVFSGQGSHWVGMGRNLLTQDPRFLEHMRNCDAAFSSWANWSILDEITGHESGSRLHHTEIVQPVIFAIQVSLARLLLDWGIEINAVCGHSMGEVAAAHIAGILSLEDATCIIYHRSRLMQKTYGKGKMLATGLPLDKALTLLHGQSDHLSVAAINSPGVTVISGTSFAIDELAERLRGQNIFCRVVQPDYAFHSPHVDSLTNEFAASIHGIHPSAARLPFFSTVRSETGDSTDFTASYWVENMRNPVLFAHAVDQMILEKCRCFIEIGPQPTLAKSIEGCLEYREVESPVIALMQQSEPDAAVLALARLFTISATLDWNKYYSTPRQYVKLPLYPWQRKRYWAEQSPRDNMIDVPDPSMEKAFVLHPLVHKRVDVPLKEIIFESSLSIAALPYLADHQVYGTIIFPASGYVEMALIAAKEAFGEGSYKISNVALTHPLVVEPGAVTKVQVILSKNDGAEILFKIYSVLNSNADKDDGWQLNSSGLVATAKKSSHPGSDLNESNRLTYSTRLPVDQYYLQLRELGLEYGPFFQAIQEIWGKEKGALARICLPTTLQAAAGPYECHPVILDACFQAVKAAISQKAGEKADDCYLPVFLDNFQVFEKMPAEVWCEALLQPVSDITQTLKADILIYNLTGNLVGKAEGLLLKPVSLELLQLSGRRQAENWMYQEIWKIDAEPLPASARVVKPGESWVIFSGVAQAGPLLLAEALKHQVQCIVVQPGENYSIPANGSFIINPEVPAHFSRLLTDIRQSGIRSIDRIIHLWSLEDSFEEDSATASFKDLQILGCGSVLHLCQALHSSHDPALPRLTLVTRGGQPVISDEAPLPWQSLLWGFGKVVSLDFPSLRSQRIDLDITENTDETVALFNEITSVQFTDQVAFRNNARYLPKISRYAPNREADLKIPETANYQLAIAEKGILDNLSLKCVERQAPKDQEVEIEVVAAGLNFRDVMIAMGLYQGEGGPLGYECAGVVTAIGARVQGLKIGDEVVAVASGSFSKFVSTDAQLVVLKPKNISFSQGATIPIAFLTAYYTLNHLGKMMAGDRVLIHSASGGVGIAAIQLAQAAGAEIYATAGNPEKRHFLTSLGITHIMNSRSLEYAKEILQDTGGEGVDLVLNSLPGDYIPGNLSALSDAGRFLEIGKTGIWSPAEVAAIKKDVSYHVVDLSELFLSEPVLMGSIFRKIMADFEKGILKPLPIQNFGIGKAISAFRNMAQAKHIGKVIITLRENGSASPSDLLPFNFSADATYLVTGGTGGLGLQVARWLVENGARHLVLIARKKPSPDIVATLNEMRLAKVHVEIFQADLAVFADMDLVFKQIAGSMPHLKGIIHTAGVLEDGNFLKQEWSQFIKPLAPKVIGTWHLHRLTANMPLDFFVSFSSMASLLGSPHQGNYAAANAFLDSMAYYRRAKGLPATTINWGPWSGSGMTAALNESQRQRFKSLGISLITAKIGLQILGNILRDLPARIAVLPINLSTFLHQFGKSGYPAVFSELSHELASTNKPENATEQSESPLLKQLKSNGPAERQKILTEHITEQVIKILRLDNGQSLDPGQGFFELGMDSLMAVELKNRIENSLGISLSVALTFDYPNINVLAGYLAGQIPDANMPIVDVTEEKMDDEERKQLISEIQHLSNEELEALLDDELKEVNK